MTRTDRPNWPVPTARLPCVTNVDGVGAHVAAVLACAGPQAPFCGRRPEQGICVSRISHRGLTGAVYARDLRQFESWCYQHMSAERSIVQADIAASAAAVTSRKIRCGRRRVAASPELAVFDGPSRLV